MVNDTAGASELAGLVPGFPGYSHQGSRVEADKLVRLKLASELAVQRDRLAELEVDLFARRDNRVAQIERAFMELQFVVDAVIKFDPSGPWLDRARLREEDVEFLLRIDSFLVRGVGRITDKVSEIIASRHTEGQTPSVGDLVAICREMAEKLEQRAEVIQNPLA